MPQRLTNPSYAVLALGALSVLGCLLRWSLDALETSPQSDTSGWSFGIGVACLVIACVSFALAEQWPVRVGGLGMLLGLGLVARLPLLFWLAMLAASVCLLVVVVGIQKITRA